MKTELYGRNFFLSLELRRRLMKPSQIEGLHRRFPQAWMNREKYPFTGHIILQEMSLKEEFLNTVCYCLTEYASEDEALAKELKTFILNKDRNLYHHIKNLKVKELKAEGFKETFINRLNLSDMGISELVHLSVLDYFINDCNARYPEEHRAEFFERWDMISHFILDHANNKHGRGLFSNVASEVRNKRTPLHKQVVEFYKDYEQRIGESLVHYLNHRLFDSEEGLDDYEYVFLLSAQSYGLKHKSMTADYRLTQSMIYEIIGSLFFMRSMYLANVENRTETPDEINKEEVYEFFDQFLVVHAYLYTIAHIQAESRDFFFKMYSTSDSVTLKALEKELAQMKKEKRELKTTVKEQTSKLNQQQQLFQKQLNQKMKTQEQGHLETQKQVERLQKENHVLKSENQSLKERIQALEAQLRDREVELKESLSTPTLEDLNQPQVAIVGGSPNLIPKLKEQLPHCKYIEMDKSYKDDYLKSIKFAYIFKDYVNHGMVYQINKVANPIKRTLTATNIDRILDQMKKSYL